MRDTLDNIIKSMVIAGEERESYALSENTLKMLDEISGEFKKSLQEHNQIALYFKRDDLLNWQIAEAFGKATELMIEIDGGFGLSIDAHDSKILFEFNDTDMKQLVMRRKSFVKESLSLFTDIGGEGANCGLCKVVPEEHISPKDISYLAVEMIMDMWLRFGANDFVVQSFKEDGNVFFFMFWNNTTRVQLQEYWKENYYVGWSPHGQFWKREWVRKEQRGNISKSGKIVREEK
jgi:hypothetical protein